MSSKREQSRLITRRRVVLIISFLGALCFTFSDSAIDDFVKDEKITNRLREKPTLVRRSVKSPVAPQEEYLHHAKRTEECPYQTDLLGGDISINANESPDWSVVNSLIGPEVSSGGCYTPPDCYPRQRVAIIIPYKNREQHLKSILATLHPMLQRQRSSYCIFVSEQEDEGRFNKGAVMNAAFREVTKSGSFDCIIFHDVDMLPENDYNIYQCENSPVHLSPLIDKFGYKYTTLLAIKHFLKNP
jgi:hypothetical protein